jgi:hypothetical protein
MVMDKRIVKMRDLVQLSGGSSVRVKDTLQELTEVPAQAIRCEFRRLSVCWP